MEIQSSVKLLNLLPFNPNQTDLCIDCGINVRLIKEYNYVVRRELWREYVGHTRCGKICIGCLEQRLGRQLTKNDFGDWPINYMIRPRSERLQQRLKDFILDIMEPMMKGG